jgi:hypothetical protein
MKKSARLSSYLMFFLFLTLRSYAQETQKDTTWAVNLLQSPSSPTFILMGIEPTNIEQPTNPTDLAISFRNATNNFSALPQNFSLQFAPVWLFGGRKITFQDFKSPAIGKSIPQSLTFSIGYLNKSQPGDSIQKPQIGMGFKFSILRGTFSRSIDSLLNRRLAVLDKLSSNFTKEISSSPEFTQLSDAIAQTKDSLERLAAKPNPTEADKLNKTLYQQQLVLLTAQLNTLTARLKATFTERYTADLAFLTDSVNRVPFNRYGVKLDVSGGMLLDFPDGRFNYSQVTRYGVWLTGGYEPEDKKISALGVGRLLYSPNERSVNNDIPQVQDNLTLDLGTRLILTNTPRKFNLSGEIVYRTYINNANIDPSWRYTVNFDYQFLKNQIVTFSLGRNFDNVVNRGGNLVAVVNLLFGLGSQRNINTR